MSYFLNKLSLLLLSINPIDYSFILRSTLHNMLRNSFEMLREKKKIKKNTLIFF